MLVQCRAVKFSSGAVRRFTLDGLAKKRGRPSTGLALSTADRVRKTRLKQKARFEEDAAAFTDWTVEALLDGMVSKGKIAIQCYIEFGRRRGWVSVDLRVVGR